jgi:hypothetical protein
LGKNKKENGLPDVQKSIIRSKDNVWYPESEERRMNMPDSLEAQREK